MEYYEKEYKNLIDGVTFKFKKLNTIEHIELAMDSATWETKGNKKTKTKDMLLGVYRNVLFSKEGGTYRELVDYEGNSNLPELDTRPNIALDLFYLFKEEVIFPVFTESKTFQKDTHQ